MTLDEAHETLYKRLIDQWESATPIELDGEPSDESKTLTDAWVKVRLPGLATQWRTIGRTGSRRFRRRGTFVVDVHTRVGGSTGGATSESSTLAQSVLDAMEAVTVSGVEIEAGDVQRIGHDGRWFVTQVVLPFNFDEVK